jgi:tetratricopeptide (TPR) repeat protein
LATWKVLAAALLLVAITALAFRYREHRPYLLAGWLWYLVAMIPMIGVVQVGRQAMADRYAYLPFVGLFVVAVWGCGELFVQLKLSSFAQRAIAAAAVVAYASMAFLQINYWHNSYTLFSHALAVTSHNGIAEDNLGTALMEMGRPDLAQPHFEAAAEFVPQLSTAHYNLGVLQQQQDHPDAARREYELALKYSSDASEAAQTHSNLGFLMLEQNDYKAATEQFTAALQINPDKQNSLLGRGIAEYRQSNLDAAVADLSRAAQIAPMAQADFWLGRVLEDKGQTQAAASAYAVALQLAPGMAEAQQRLDALRGKH